MQRLLHQNSLAQPVGRVLSGFNLAWLPHVAPPGAPTMRCETHTGWHCGRARGLVAVEAAGVGLGEALSLQD